MSTACRQHQRGIKGGGIVMDFSNRTVYQVYPKSFCDSNADSRGDLRGLTSKLEYIASLGVDYIWITPFFVSPQNDNGYDVADYREIDPAFGTMTDFDDLMREAHRKNLGIMLDMVFNHTSTSHEWFQRALSGDERYQDYYIFRDGDPSIAPTNWTSKFGGPAWEYVPSLGKWYLHLFDVTQADLNWDNPEVRDALAQVIEFWKAKGVSGFRFDVVNLISKPMMLEDDHEGDGRRFYTDGPHVHEYLNELVRRTGICDYVTVGEMSSTTLDQCIGYSHPSRHELSMTFSFHHLKIDYGNGDKWTLASPDIAQLQHLLKTWQEGMQAGGGWNALFWCNHDQPRIVSRLGDDGALHRESAKMLAACCDLMRGTPYVYQGEELGMTNAHFDSLDEWRDVESLNYHHILMERGLSSDEALTIIAERSRDNGRTPMQWGMGHAAGFTMGTPWIEPSKSTSTCDESLINVASESDDQLSVLAFYKQLIALRKNSPVIATGGIRFLDDAAVPVIAYLRSGNIPIGVSGNVERVMAEKGSILVLSNISCEDARVGSEVVGLVSSGAWEILFDSYDDSRAWDGTTPALRPFEGVVLRMRARD